MPYISADPLLDAEALRAAPGGELGEPWLPRGAVFVEWGRVALWGALRALGFGPGDRLVVPAYICDSILPAPAALGVEVRYVPTDRGLRPDLAAVERELAGGARALLAVHYFGFAAPSLEALGGLCERYGAALIEDCAHALFSQVDGRPLGSRGAAAIYSPWKSLPLPDGGALVVNAAGGEPEWAAGGSRVGERGQAPAERVLAELRGLPRPGAAMAGRRLAYRAIGVVETALGRSPRLALLRSWGLRRRMQARVAQAPLRPRRASTLAERIARGADWRAIVARRRANYSRLHEAVRRAGWARPLYDDLPDGICPLGLPLLAERRESAREQLLAAGVNVRAYWEQLPAGVSVEAYADAHAVAERILILPVHQSLTSRQIEYLLRVVATLETS